MRKNNIVALFATLVAAATLQGCISAKSVPTAEAEPAAPAPAPVVVAEIGDADGDGIRDDLDACANTRSGVEVDARGCEILYRFSGPLFDFDQSTIRPDAKVVLEQAAAVLRRNPAKAVELAGHTDSVGSEAYNVGLGMRRAESVKRFLAEMGIGTDHLAVVSLGESHPVADNMTRDGRQQNRRVEIVEQPTS